MQDLAKQATKKKAEKKKNHLSLPMRGRHMYIGDKTREHMIRCEILKQANESSEMQILEKNARFLDHIKQLEDQMEQRMVDSTLTYQMKRDR